MTSKIFKKTVLAFVLAGVYGFLNYLTFGLQLPGAAAIVSIRPQIIMPLLGGYLMGPFYGFIIGGFGNLLGDYLCGASFMYWAFSLGNGIMGALLGVPRVWERKRFDKIETVSEFSTLLLMIIAANIIGIGIGLIIFNSTHRDSINQLTWLFFHPILVTNIIVSYLLIPPVLFIFKRMRGTFDIRLCVYLLYILITIVIAIIFIISITDSRMMSGKLNSVFSSEEIGKLMKDIFMNIFRYGGTIGIIFIIAGVSLTLLLVQSLLKPVYKLMDAATKLKDGKTDEIDLKCVTKHQDALGKLAQVFEEAVNSVRMREEKLKIEIEKLQVVINKDQEDKQVKEITETEYFKNLREKSMNLREGKDKKRT